MVIDRERDLFPVAVDRREPGSVDLHQPFGDHEPKVLFLLDLLGIGIGGQFQNDGVGLVKRIDRPVPVTCRPVLREESISSIAASRMFSSA